MSDSHGAYYIPDPSQWPILGSIGLFFLFAGSAMLFNGYGGATLVFTIGALVFLYVLYGWFGQVIRESQAGHYNHQVDVSFRWGMGWFIFSEVMFFAAFFGALFYARALSIPWLAGEGSGFSTHQFLWPDFVAAWPLLQFPSDAFYKVPEAVIPAWGLPAINTLILLTSGVTITFAHWAIKKNDRSGLVRWLFATIALGLLFLGIQMYEYVYAYRDLGLTLNAGIYGATFFMLTGFHGLHVTLGAIMLIVIWLRCIKGHFTADNHFGFEAVAWYWHFVDVVWLFLFIFVYWF